MQNKTFAMTAEDVRLLGEALMLLLVVKQTARAVQDAKQVQALMEKMLGEDGGDEPQVAIGV